jgi:hypothetical protein
LGFLPVAPKIKNNIPIVFKKIRPRKLFGLPNQLLLVPLRFSGVLDHVRHGPLSSFFLLSSPPSSLAVKPIPDQN